MVQNRRVQVRWVPWAPVTQKDFVTRVRLCHQLSQLKLVAKYKQNKLVLVPCDSDRCSRDSVIYQLQQTMRVSLDSYAFLNPMYVFVRSIFIVVEVLQLFAQINFKTYIYDDIQFRIFSFLHFQGQFFPSLIVTPLQLLFVHYETTLPAPDHILHSLKFASFVEILYDRRMYNTVVQFPILIRGHLNGINLIHSSIIFLKADHKCTLKVQNLFIILEHIRLSIEAR